MLMQGEDVTLWPARSIASAVAAGEVSALSLYEAVAERIEHSHASLNAIVRLDMEAGRQQARQADRLARQGLELPLLGVPFTVKDNIFVQGQVVSQGALSFKDFVAPGDALAVARLRAAGAVLVGVTNCPEFAVKGTTDNLLYGVTRNPWNTDCTTGGSSGGSAAAVAAGLGTFSIGTDAGGSIRRPAAYCGVLGMKPSQGVVPDPYGFDDPSMGLSVVGPMARRVDDLAVVMQCIAGYHPGDAACVPVPDWSFDTALDESVPHHLRIAFSPDLGMDLPCDPRVMACLRHAIRQLESRGLTVEDASPEWPPAARTYDELACERAGLSALYGPACTPGLSRDVARQMEIGERLSASQVAGAMLGRRRVFEAWHGFFQRYDVLLCPVSPITAWQHGAPPAEICGRQVGPRGHAAFTPLFNVGGLPACSVPVGQVEGMPVGLHVAAARFEDRRVLQVAHMLQCLLPQPSVPVHLRSCQTPREDSPDRQH